MKTIQIKRTLEFWKREVDRRFDRLTSIPFDAPEWAPARLSMMVALRIYQAYRG